MTTMNELRKAVSGRNREAFKVVDEISQFQKGKKVLETLLNLGIIGEKLWYIYRVKYNCDSINLYCDYKEVKIKKYK